MCEHPPCCLHLLTPQQSHIVRLGNALVQFPDCKGWCQPILDVGVTSCQIYNPLPSVEPAPWCRLVGKHQVVLKFAFPC